MKQGIKEKGQIMMINKGASAAETLMQMLLYFCDTLPSSNFRDVQQHVCDEGAANIQTVKSFKAMLAASSKTHVSHRQALWVM